MRVGDVFRGKHEDVAMAQDESGNEGMNVGALVALLVSLAVACAITLGLFSCIATGSPVGWLIPSGGGGSVDAGDVDVDADAALREVMEIPEFLYVDQDGNEITRAVFEGEWTVLSFIFTNCPLICPITTGNMYQLSEATEGSRLRFAMLTVDPEHDTPEVLSGYLGRFGFDMARTRALIPPDEAAVRSFVEGGVKLGLTADPADMVPVAGGGEMANIDHPTRFLLIGPDVTVRGSVDGREMGEVRELATLFRELAG